MDRRAYYRAFYETPPQKLVRAGAAAVLAWVLQWLMLTAALVLRSVALGEPVRSDALGALLLLALAGGLLAWRTQRPGRC